MSSRAAGARFRQRKLSTKHALQILHEDDLLDAVQDDDDPARQVPRVETGVERAEETEHHLQAVISASAAASLGGKVAQIYIPTPETKSSHVAYDELYPKHFSQPTTYIRFSSTVEDCIGPPYCSTADDDKFVTGLNESKTGKDGKLSLDLFEEVLSFFEATASARQPFATIDNPPVLTFEELQSSYDDTISAEGQKWAPDLYDHWHALREATSNTPLMPNLKFETGAETDDADAYVCFRRREVRQARKTRGRDAQVVEKMKKLRRELEDARQMVHSVNAREKLNLERLEIERKVFEQRQELKRVKIQHGIKGDRGEDEELFVNQRPVVKPKVKLDAPPGPGHRPSMLRLSASGRTDRAGAPEQDLLQLEDVKDEIEAAVRKQVESKIFKHREWNKGFVDNTWLPICPPEEGDMRSDYLPVVREVQLPTPPASVEGEGEKMDVDGEKKRDEDVRDLPTPVSDDASAQSRGKTMFRFQSPMSTEKKTMPTFRRRYGRLGRLHIDAIKPKRVVPAEQAGVVYDSDSELEADGDDAIAMYPVDYWSGYHLQYRASLMLQRKSEAQLAAEQAAKRSSTAAPGPQDIAMAGGAGTAGQAAGSSVGGGG